MSTTTVRVPRELHERLARHAAERNTSLAGAIAHALDTEERAAFWAAVRTTMGTPEAVTALRADAEAHSGSLKDGLDPDESWDDVL